MTVWRLDHEGSRGWASSSGPDEDEVSMPAPWRPATRLEVVRYHLTRPMLSLVELAAILFIVSWLQGVGIIRP